MYTSDFPRMFCWLCVVLMGTIWACASDLLAEAVRVNPPPGTIPDVTKLPMPRIQRLPVVKSKDMTITLDGGRIGTARRNWPVRFAVAIPHGELADPANVSLKAADGRAVPVQAKATCYWPAGEVKWLLLEFLCDLPAEGRARYTLTYGTDVKPAPAGAIKVAEAGGAVSVDTGGVAFTAATGATFIKNLTVRGKAVSLSGGGLAGFMEYSLSPVPDPAKTSLADRAHIPLSQSLPAKEVLHAAPQITSVKVVERGPVQVTLLLEGQYKTKTVAHPVRMYVTAYAGSPLLLVRHSLIYAGYPERDALRSYGLDLQLAQAGGQARFGLAGGGPLTGRKLIQKDDQQLLLDAGQDPRPIQGRSSGWVHAGKVAAAVKDLWKNYPVGFEVRDSDGKATLRTALLGCEDGAFLDLRYRVKELSSTYDGGGYCSARGLQKTHSVMYLLDSGAPGAPDVDSLAAALDQPPLIVPDPAHIEQTGVLGVVGMYQGDDQMDPLGNSARLILDWAMYSADNNRWYGFADYGDVNASAMSPQGDRLPHRFAGGVGWASGNHLVSTYFIHYLLTGQRKYFDFGSAFAQHKVDIDFEHLGGEGEEILLGEFSRHNQIHWRTRGGPRQAPIQGLIRKYWLTGDRVTMDALELAMVWLRRPDWANKSVLDTSGVSYHCKAGARYWPAYLYGQTVNDPSYFWFVKPFAATLEQTLDQGLGIGYQDGGAPVDKDGRPDVSNYTGTGVPGGYFFTYEAVSPLADYLYLTGDTDVARALVKLGYVLASKPAWLRCNQPYYTYDRFLALAYEITGDRTFYDTIYKYRLARYLDHKGTPQETYTTKTLLDNLGRLFSPGTNNMGLMLTATKEFGFSARAYHLAKKYPVASCGGDQVVTAGADGVATVRLDGSASKATVGKLVEFEWTAGEGAARKVLAETAVADVKLPVGSHSVLLRVKDEQGMISHDRMTVTVQARGTLRINFQPAGAFPVTGYAPGAEPFDEKLGFGWDGKVRTYKESFSPPRYGARLEGDNVVVNKAQTKTFRARLPDGDYRVAVGIGSPWSEADGTRRVSFQDSQVALHMTMAKRIVANFVNLPVKVSGGQLSMDVGGPDSGTTHVCYLRTEPADKPAAPMPVEGQIDSPVGIGNIVQLRTALGCAKPPQPYAYAKDVWDQPAGPLKMPIIATGQIPGLETELAEIPAKSQRTFSIAPNTYLVRTGRLKTVYLDLGLCAPDGTDGAVAVQAGGKELFRIESMPKGTILRLRNLVVPVADGKTISFTITNAAAKPIGASYVRARSYNQYIFIRQFPW